MANRILSDLIGTLRTFFRIGNLRLKNNLGHLEVRNLADTAHANIAAAEHQFRNAGGFGMNIAANPAAAVNTTLTLPDGDAPATTNDYALVSDGAGQLSWVQVSTGNNAVKKQSEVVTFSSASPVAMFTPPANAIIQTVICDVDTAFNGAPSLSVGVAGDTGRYMAASENELTTTGVYETSPEYKEDGTPEAIIVTFAAGGATQGSAEVTVIYANPA